MSASQITGIILIIVFVLAIISSFIYDYYKAKKFPDKSTKVCIDGNGDYVVLQHHYWADFDMSGWKWNLIKNFGKDKAAAFKFSNENNAKVFYQINADNRKTTFKDVKE